MLKQETIKAYLCHWCSRIYTPERPFLCECKSNCFLKEYDTTKEELDSMKKHSDVKIIFNTSEPPKPKFSLARFADKMTIPFLFGVKNNGFALGYKTCLV